MTVGARPQTSNSSILPQARETKSNGLKKPAGSKMGRLQHPLAFPQAWIWRLLLSNVFLGRNERNRSLTSLNIYGRMILTEIPFTNPSIKDSFRISLKSIDYGSYKGKSDTMADDIIPCPPSLIQKAILAPAKMAFTSLIDLPFITPSTFSRYSMSF